MSITELENWLSKVKNFSVSELLTVQERVTQELKSKTANLPISSVQVVTANGFISNAVRDDTDSSDEDELPLELKQEVVALTSMGDKALWKVARSHLPAKDAQKLRQLNHKQQKYGRTSLTETELQTLEELGYQYDRHILLRSQAMLLLKERGHDISPLLKAS